MKLLVGLGNPGDKYQKTRHNLGFLLLDEYAKKKLGPQIVWEVDKKFDSEILKLSKDLWLVKPQTFMNNSGQAVKTLVDYFQIPLEDVILLHDDLDLMLGKIKVRSGGGTSGHRGMESVISSLGDEKFVRVRLGIGNEKSHSGEHKRIHFSAERFVLESFMPGEKSKVKHMLRAGIEALDLLINEGLEKAQNQFN